MKKNIALFILFILVLLSHEVQAQRMADIIVDAKGNGDYRTITEAINSLSMYPYQRTVVFVKNGVYEERIRIEKNYITLRGESRDSTIVRYSLPRNEWNKAKDYTGPGIINIDGDDIVLDNLTIENSQPEIGPHAFAVYGLTCNRVIIINCNVLSKGGDTVSLWNYKQGIYYHANCRFEGAVDFVCPRGWCFVRDCQFYEVKETAALWHAGNYNPDQKFVILHSTFDGVQNFELGRHHYEAQMFLIDCIFSASMANRPIYWSKSDNPEKNNLYYGGDRIYYYNCEKEGVPYSWYQNNLNEAPGQPKPEEITPLWTFAGKWDPESNAPIEIVAHEIDGAALISTFNEIVTVRQKPVLKNKSGKSFPIIMQRFNDIHKLSFSSANVITDIDLKGEWSIAEGEIINSIASVTERKLKDCFFIVE